MSDNKAQRVVSWFCCIVERFRGYHKAARLKSLRRALTARC
jgi:hypothetical protein